MPSQHEPVIKQEKKSQSQPVSQENNNTEEEKVLSKKLSQLSSQETNVGTDEIFDPELPGYSDADDKNDETEEKPTVEEHRNVRKKHCKMVYHLNFPYANPYPVAAPKKKFHSVVKAEKEEAAAANLPQIAKNSAADPEWLSEQVAVLKEKRDKEKLRSCYESRFRTKSVDSVDSKSQEEDEEDRVAEKKK